MLPCLMFSEIYTKSFSSSESSQWVITADRVVFKLIDRCAVGHKRCIVTLMLRRTLETSISRYLFFRDKQSSLPAGVIRCQDGLGM